MASIRVTYERALLAILFLVCLCLWLVNPAFASPGNLLDLASSASVLGLFALGEFLVMLTGGIDISFTAIAAVSFYSTAKLAASYPERLPFILVILIAVCIGSVLGSINAIFVAVFRLPALIVTLGTAALFHGLLLTFLGSRMVTDLPSCFTFPATTHLAEFQVFPGEVLKVPVLVLFFPFFALVVAFLLRSSLPGRGIYALGGGKEAARRIGFPVSSLEFFVYSFSGFLSGLAGFLHAARMRNANPFDLLGSELDVIAAVVLGGTSLTGGRGTVGGLLSGIALFMVVNKNLVLLGVPSSWQRVFVGAVLIFSTAATEIISRNKNL